MIGQKEKSENEKEDKGKLYSYVILAFYLIIIGSRLLFTCSRVLSVIAKFISIHYKRRKSVQVRKSTKIRRLQILQVIRSIISSKGIEGVTISEIAMHMGITKGAIYRHFKSKKDILNLLIENIEGTLMEVIDNSVDEDPIQCLKNILLNQLVLAKNRRKTSLVVILGAMQFSDPSIKKKISQTVEKYLCRIEEILSKAIESGVVKNKVNPKISAIAFFGLIQSSITMWSYKKFDFVPEELHSQLWNIYIKGIGV